ncbi:MAG: YfcE family phosphodiesterase [Candidatus Thorarchaeota archaeon]
MVKFGILSDTLIQSRDSKIYVDNLLSQISEAFKTVDDILHAGNIIDFNFLKQLEEIAPVRCVKGSLDEIANLKEFLKISAGLYNIGLIHNKPKNLEDFFKQNGIHILIYGNTRQAVIENTKFNTMLINPGSPTKPIAPPAKIGFQKPIARPSVITLEINSDNILSTYLVNLKKY